MLIRPWCENETCKHCLSTYWTVLSPARKERHCNIVSQSFYTWAQPWAYDIKKVGRNITKGFLPSSSILCRWWECAWAITDCDTLYVWAAKDFSEPLGTWYWQWESQTSRSGRQGSTWQAMHCICLVQLAVPNLELGQAQVSPVYSKRYLHVFYATWQENSAAGRSWYFFWDAVWPCMWETVGDAVWSGRIKC